MAMRTMCAAVLSFTLLLGAVAGGAAESPNERQLHMREHLDRLEAIKAELLVGELANARESAMWLAEHEPLEDLHRPLGAQ